MVCRSYREQDQIFCKFVPGMSKQTKTEAEKLGEQALKIGQNDESLKQWLLDLDHDDSIGLSEKVELQNVETVGQHLFTASDCFK